jgi:hypothetical protein
MSLVHIERTKLLATALNNAAVAIMATAIIAPVAGFLYVERCGKQLVGRS